MLSSFSSAPARTDLIRTPTEVFVQRDCFCFMQRNINGIINTEGKVKPKNNVRDVPAGCMKKNTASAKTVCVSDTKSQPHFRYAESQSAFEHVKNNNVICFFKYPETIAKIPEKRVDEDNANLSASSMAVPSHEIIDDKEVDSVEDTEEAVEEMGEGSDDGSGFFRVYQNRFDEEENGGFSQKAQRYGAARQDVKIAAAAEHRYDLATPTMGRAENKSYAAEKLIKALHAGLFFI